MFAGRGVEPMRDRGRIPRGGDWHQPIRRKTASRRAAAAGESAAGAPPTAAPAIAAEPRNDAQKDQN